MATSTKTVAQKKALARASIVEPKLAPSVNALRSRLGLSRKMFSRLAGFSERAIADWESGKPLSEPGLRRVKELDRLRERLSEIVNEEAIPTWLDCAE